MPQLCAVSTEAHDPGPPKGTPKGHPSVAADKSVSSAKMSDSEDDSSPPKLRGRHISIGQSAKIKEDTMDAIEDSNMKLVILQRPGDNSIVAEERNRGRLHFRSRQAMFHSGLTEVRIGELEKAIYKLRQEVHGLPDDWKLPEMQRMHPVYDHKLARLGPSQFPISQATFETDRKSRPALEVLTNEHNQDKSQMTSRRIPERVRIRTMPLVKHIRRIGEEDL